MSNGSSTVPQGLAILGATGSIGCSTLDVVRLHPTKFKVKVLTGHRRVTELLAQAHEFRPTYVVLPDDRTRDEFLRQWSTSAGTPPEVLTGPQALCDVAVLPEVDLVMAAIVGAAGLPACLAAARAGKRLLLANKEALVVGGQLFIDAVKEGGATLVPIDSEHSAIFQCLPMDRTAWGEVMDHIILTASGGPFRSRDLSTFDSITPAQAVAHPNWSMGHKISVDSATMMNKALEVIEARWLFDLAPENIRVVLHPQSVIHSMVVCRDASVLAQLGTPDMKVPIAYGLSYPKRVNSGAASLDFTRLAAMTFEAMDLQRFPGLGLAYEAMASTEGSTTVLNAANELAVEAFLASRIGFTDIHRVNRATIDDLIGRFDVPGDLEALLSLDGQARRVARHHVGRLSR